MSFNDQQHRGEAAGYYDGNNLQLDQEQAIRQARYEKHGREDKEDDDDSLFSKAMGFLNNKKDKVGREDIDEQKVVRSHQMLYGDKDDRDEKHGAESLGSGAAMQALKMFMNSSGNQNQSQGGGDQNKLVGMAMAQAGQMWEQKNQQGRVNTDKQTAVNMAAEYALKMYIKGQMGGGSTGAGGLGGLGGLALISSALGGSGGQQQQGGGLAALAGALTGGGQQQQQQQQPSGLAAIAGALGGGGGQQQHQQQQQQQNQQQGDGASNLLNMASKFLK